MSKSKTESTIKSNQEQAVASWINYLNQIRLDRLFSNLNKQDVNLEQAISTLDDTLDKIENEIIIKNRGGTKGMHGFIAEVSECGIVNARHSILGEPHTCEWINDNGPTDLIRNGINIQQKFVNSCNHLSLQAIQKHLTHYPDYISEGGKYQIPSDHYDKIKYLLSIPKDKAYKMPTETGEFSLKQWKEVHAFFENGDIKLDDIEPSQLSYDSVQSAKIESTIESEKESIKETDKDIRKEYYEESKPTFQEGAKATAISALTEGGFTFAFAIIKRIKSGKSIKEFTKEDWEEIVKETGISTVKGGVRGASIYLLTNFTATPAAVASSLVTASFGVAQQAFLFRSKEISKEDFLLNSEMLFVDVTVSALSSLIGQSLIPIPVLGAVIGNTIGTLLYQTAKDNLIQKEKNIIKGYIKEIDSLTKSLDEEYNDLIKNLNKSLVSYMSLLNAAFVLDPEEAFKGSINLAIFVGVESVDILKTREEIDNYFLC